MRAGFSVRVLALAGVAATLLSGGARAQNQQLGQTDFEIVNAGTVPIVRFYAAKADSTEWGNNRLSGTIAPGQRVMMRLPPGDGCQYKLQAVYQGEQNSTRLNMNVCAFSDMQFAAPPPANAAQRPPAQVAIKNVGGPRLLQVLMSPSNESKSFGPNRLPRELGKDESADVALPNPNQCAYDIRAVFPGNIYEDRYRVNFCVLSGQSFAGPGAPPSGGGGGSSGGNSAQQQVRPPVQQQQQANQGKGVVVLNRYRVPLTEVQVDPSDQQGWSASRMPQGSVIHPGDRVAIPLPQAGGCIWDLKATFDNEVDQEIDKIDVCKFPVVEVAGPRPGILLSTGTGFFISRDGHVLTNNHVVYGCKSVAIDRGSSGILPLRIVGQDTTEDLAILQQTGVTTPALDFRSPERALRPGETAIVIGYPLRSSLGALTVTEGIVSATESRGSNGSQFQMQTPIQSGNSGGPVFDNRGQVIGVAVAALSARAGRTVQNVNFAVKAEAARQFAQSLGVQLSFSNSSDQKSTADIVEEVRGRVLPLNCYN